MLCDICFYFTPLPLNAVILQVKNIFQNEQVLKMEVLFFETRHFVNPFCYNWMLIMEVSPWLESYTLLHLLHIYLYAVDHRAHIYHRPRYN